MQPDEGRETELAKGLLTRCGKKTRGVLLVPVGPTPHVFGTYVDDLKS